MDIHEYAKSYWSYYLELENRMEETRRYVEFDEYNFRTYSSYYLMLFQTVCSEIDVVGKDVASYFNPDFEKERGIKSINRWWYEVQNNLPDVDREICFAGSFLLKPWDRYRVKKNITNQNRNGKQTYVTNYNLIPKTNGIVYSTPNWWNAYNKVKHQRLKNDIDDCVNYKKASLRNVSNAVTALFLLEFEFMKKIGTIEERL